MDKRQKIGKFGEELVEKYLVNNNYYIIDRNFKCTYGEIDIIAYDRKKLKHDIVFIEVKTRSNKLYGDGISAINKNKQKHLYKTIAYYLYKNNLQNNKIRVDGIEVLFENGKILLNHYYDIIIDKP